MSNSVWKKDDSILYPGDPLRYSGKLVINPGESDYLDAGYTKYEQPESSEKEVDQEAIKKEEKRTEITQIMNNIKEELSSLEYLTSKELDGEDMTEYNLKYASKAHRINLRKRYNQLEEELEKL